jgi:hypothetical protein
VLHGAFDHAGEGVPAGVVVRAFTAEFLVGVLVGFLLHGDSVDKKM